MAYNAHTIEVKSPTFIEAVSWSIIETPQSAEIFESIE
jgi:hypothetical protein